MAHTETHPVDERLPAGRLAALGLQHVLVMYAGAVAVPLIVGRALKLSPEQVAMLISLMGLFLPTIMLSGFMFPIENMPVPLQVISNAVPAKWFFNIIRNIMIKGIGFEYVWKETLILVGMTAFFLLISIRKFKTRLE